MCSFDDGVRKIVLPTAAVLVISLFAVLADALLCEKETRSLPHPSNDDG